MMELRPDIIADVARALSEDVGEGDVTALLLPPEQRISAEIISREPMLVCGKPWVDEVFAQINPDIGVHWLVKEGEWLAEPTTLCRVQGCGKDILTAERTALNFLQTLSATATKTHFFLEQVAGTGTRLLDTRKTIPGLRRAQKYAVAIAGGSNHRFGLYDAYLIKENHIKACGSITDAVRLAKETHPKLHVEVEVETTDELKEALHARPDRVLLDNFSLPQLQEAVAINKAYRCQLEASGGVTLANIRDIARTGVDFISVGELTKSIRAIDLSLLIREVQ
ncbi:carboxylating nicotinate-nucleotide diphosphorylase [Legionella spiritensis]|uniref:carboxylating nicotinate-nucleotide diphosphorylase n=1 Tax=Legionella spiritensis TaxID=452 RepID=UPI000F712B8A|nr:carboxylating nicotinate-nucleotide diphosphorylase [Legionella spiritensis]VEG90353.1 nicotinate-nucleotide pyrophosphorylase [Legionella spiritensis]